MSEGRLALVTGGMGGIGTAICRTLHAEGYRVVTTYIHDSGREERWLKQQADEGYPGIHAHYCDITSYDDCVALKDKVQSSLGAVSVLVNNGGITRDAVFAKMDAGMFSEVIDTNLKSLFNVTHQFIGGMVEQQYGRIVSVSSVNGQKGQFGQTNYSAAKAGVHGFTKALAQEVVRKGVTVNTVSPGYVATPMVMAIKDEVRQKIVDSIPMRRLCEPEEVARAIAFLADGKSGYITGANLSINGGLHMY